MSEPAEAQHVSDALASIDAALVAADQEVAQGRDVDLTGLDTQIEQVCSRIAALPVTDRRPLLAQLAALITRCDALAQTFTDAVATAHAAARPSPQAVARAYANPTSEPTDPGSQ